MAKQTATTRKAPKATSVDLDQGAHRVRLQLSKYDGPHQTYRGVEIVRFSVENDDDLAALWAALVSVVKSKGWRGRRPSRVDGVGAHGTLAAPTN